MSSPLPDKAADTTAEQPWPVRLLSMKPAMMSRPRCFARTVLPLTRPRVRVIRAPGTLSVLLRNIRLSLLVVTSRAQSSSPA